MGSPWKPPASDLPLAAWRRCADAAQRWDCSPDLQSRPTPCLMWTRTAESWIFRPHSNRMHTKCYYTGFLYGWNLLQGWMEPISPSYLCFPLASLPRRLKKRNKNTRFYFYTWLHTAYTALPWTIQSNLQIAGCSWVIFVPRTWWFGPSRLRLFPSPSATVARGIWEPAGGRKKKKSFQVMKIKPEDMLLRAGFAAQATQAFHVSSFYSIWHFGTLKQMNY